MNQTGKSKFFSVPNGFAHVNIGYADRQKRAGREENLTCLPDAFKILSEQCSVFSP